MNLHSKVLSILGIVFFLGGCSSPLKKAQSAYEAAAYQEAIVHFKKLIQAKPDKEKEYSYYVAECYRLSNRPEKAHSFYAKALNTPELPTKEREAIPYYLGVTYKASEKYDSAANYFQMYAEVGTDPLLKKKAESEVSALKQVNDILKMNSFTRIFDCEGLNTAGSDFGISVRNANTLYFSSSRKGEKIYQGNGLGFNDIYEYALTQPLKGEGTVKLLPEPLNASGLHEASPTFSPDGNTMVFAKSGSDKADDEEKEVSLYISTFENGVWTQAERHPASLVDSWDGCPSFSVTGDTLYFSSNRAGGKGGLDIYFTTKHPDGYWNPVRALEGDVNTVGNEMFPYMDAKGRFFFASDIHPGLGGLDVFVSEKNKIRNVGTPINSSADDFGLIYYNDSIGYFTSNRKSPTAKGDDDIYRFVNDSLNIREVKYFLELVSYSAKYDTNPRAILPGVKIELKDDKGNLISATSTDDKGFVKFDTALLPEKNYMIYAQIDGWLAKSSSFSSIGKGVDLKSLKKMYTEITWKTEIDLTKNILAKDPKDIFPPEIEILYDYNKATITPESAKRLDEFVLFLNEYLAVYPDVILELGSHTDERGSNTYNQKLAQRRAESAVKYIVDKGISASKIKARGYGEEEPKVKNAKTEEQHQANRRTTVKVFKASEYKGR